MLIVVSHTGTDQELSTRQRCGSNCRQPHWQVVDSGSCLISRRDRWAGSGWRLGCCLASDVVAGGCSSSITWATGLDLVFEQAALLGVEALVELLALGGEFHVPQERVLARELGLRASGCV